MYKLIISLIFFILIVSCDESGVSSPSEGPLKLVFFNNTEYDVKELYYSVNYPEYGKYGTKVDIGEKLEHKGKISICPEGEAYYFTFVRQNGSTNNNLYITSETPLKLNSNSGIVTLELLPYNFLYKTKDNDKPQCVVEN